MAKQGPIEMVIEIYGTFTAVRIGILAGLHVLGLVPLESFAQEAILATIPFYISILLIFPSIIGGFLAVILMLFLGKR